MRFNRYLCFSSKSADQKTFSWERETNIEGIQTQAGNVAIAMAGDEIDPNLRRLWSSIITFWQSNHAGKVLKISV